MKRQTSARSMRHIMTSLFAFCMLVVLAGCGGGANQAQQTQTQPAATTETSTAPAQTAPAADANAEREVKHAMGTTKIKGTPQRVVILTNEG
ncbi:iron-siderophore ABC transporter substrate-binding protein, partial [Mesorhizobium sp. M00.F.Ca.ET.186.01.1.1]